MIVSHRRTAVAWWTAVAAVVAVSWCLAGWFYTDLVVLDCAGGADRSVTCTVTRHYWLRTARTVVVGVSGVEVLTCTGDSESTSYELRFSTASGVAGPVLTGRYRDRLAAAREADRLAELVAVGPGSGVRATTTGPSSVFGDLGAVLHLLLGVVIVGAFIGSALIFFDETMLERPRRWWRRLRQLKA